MGKSKLNKILFVAVLIIIGISIYYLLNPKTDQMPLDQYLPSEDQKLQELTTPTNDDVSHLNNKEQYNNSNGHHEHHGHDENEGSPEQTSDNLLIQERVYTEKELKEMSVQTFIEVLQDTENRMPSMSDIKALPPEALHRTPLPVISAGRNLGLIKEILNVHPEYEVEAFSFYESCANNKQRPTAVRALCLTNLIEYKKKNGESVNLSNYPADLVNLVKMVTDN